MPEVTLEEIVKQCMDSGGYVIFSAHLSNEVDAQKNRSIVFNYRRYHFGFEDTKAAILQFRVMMEDDAKKELFGEPGE